MRPKATEFGEITQNNGHYAVQGHSRSPILILIESSYMASYKRLIPTYLPSCAISEIWTSIAPKSLYLATPLVFYSRDGGGPWDDLHNVFRGCQDMASVPNGKCRRNIAENFNRLGIGSTSVTDRRRTGGRQHIANEFTFAKK